MNPSSKLVDSSSQESKSKHSAQWASTATTSTQGLHPIKDRTRQTPPLPSSPHPASVVSERGISSATSASRLRIPDATHEPTNEHRVVPSARTSSAQGSLPRTAVTDLTPSRLLSLEQRILWERHRRAALNREIQTILTDASLPPRSASSRGSLPHRSVGSQEQASQRHPEQSLCKGDECAVRSLPSAQRSHSASGTGIVGNTSPPRLQRDALQALESRSSSSRIHSFLTEIPTGPGNALDATHATACAVGASGAGAVHAKVETPALRKGGPSSRLSHVPWPARIIRKPPVPSAARRRVLTLAYDPRLARRTFATRADFYVAEKRKEEWKKRVQND